MRDSSIDISGVVQKIEFPRLPKNYPFSEICETYNFHIPKGKPNIHKILKLFIDTSIKEIKTIDAPWGKRTIVQGLLHIKVFYSADRYSKNIYFVYIDVPIYTFLAGESTVDVSILIEDAVIHKLDSRNISISCLLFVFAKLGELNFLEQNNVTRNSNDIDKKQSDETADYCNNENSKSYFENGGELEFNIEYDMNSDSLQEDYDDEEKKECQCEF